MKKENNPVFMTRDEFEEYKKTNKFCNFPYEYYRVYPLLSKNSREKLVVFLRDNPSTVEIIEKTAQLLKEEQDSTTL